MLMIRLVKNNCEGCKKYRSRPDWGSSTIPAVDRKDYGEEDSQGLPIYFIPTDASCCQRPTLRGFLSCCFTLRAIDPLVSLLMLTFRISHWSWCLFSSDTDPLLTNTIYHGHESIFLVFIQEFTTPKNTSDKQSRLQRELSRASSFNDEP
jgi:hypothetical protein